MSFTHVWKCFAACIVTCLPAALASAAPSATILFEDRVVVVEEVLPDATDLWVRPQDLSAVNGFVLKPEGACFEDICVPVQQDRDSDIYIKRGSQAWFSVTELADRLRQPYIADHDSGTWSFGAIPASRQLFTRQGIAPDFTLQDMQGNDVSLSDFKGKKIMLLSWASW